MNFKNYKRVSSDVTLMPMRLKDIIELSQNNNQVVVDGKPIQVSIIEDDQQMINEAIAANDTNDEIIMYLVRNGQTDFWGVAAEFASSNYFCEVLDVSKLGEFDFGTAVSLMRLGHKVARKGWNGKGMFIFLVPGSTFKVNRPPLLGIYDEGTEIDYQPHIDMKTADDKVVPWSASQSDVLAEDWGIGG